jgi:nucleotide-binding universal stress UspA family protein
MRLLLATDGTPGALTAVDLVAGVRWPSDLVVDVVAVVDAGAPTAFAFAPVPVVHGYDEERTANALATAREAAARLGRHGIIASARVIHGREADSIVQRAIETETSLIVCGSRGHGPLRARLLGSVSAEVVQRAHCSVLVARHPTIGGVTLATDGSVPSLAAEHLVMRLPLFAQAPIDVVTVTDLLTNPDDAHTSQLHHVLELQHEATERLRRCGRTAREIVLSGDPAHEIVEAARRANTDLIVMGTHGRSGLDRLLLGSVARDVLAHSHASVLVAREPVVQPQRGGGSRVRIEPVASIRLRSLACA